MYETKNAKRLNRLARELVPATGKADSLAGEMVRATARIGYRFFNDGDQIGIGYGKVTCNPPARFLAAHCPLEIVKCLDRLWELYNGSKYERLLDVLVGMVADYVESRPELRSTATEDMFDYRDPKEDRDDDDEEGY